MIFSVVEIMIVFDVGVNIVVLLVTGEITGKERWEAREFLRLNQEKSIAVTV